MVLEGFDNLDELGASLQRVLNGDTANKVIIPERFEVLKEVFGGFIGIFKVLPRIDLRPNFYSGGVCIDIPSFELNADELLSLKAVLGKCDCFEICPLNSGKLAVSATLKIYK